MPTDYSYSYTASLAPRIIYYVTSHASVKALACCLILWHHDVSQSVRTLNLLTSTKTRDVLETRLNESMVELMVASSQVDDDDDDEVRSEEEDFIGVSKWFSNHKVTTTFIVISGSLITFTCNFLITWALVSVHMNPLIASSRTEEYIIGHSNYF